MKRSPYAVALGAAAVASVMVLPGCALFQRTSSEETVPAPPAVSSTEAGATASSAVRASASPSVTASTTRTSDLPTRAPTPPTVPGYTLAGSDAAAQRRFAAVATEYKVVFSGLTSRRVVKGKDQLGSLVLLGLRPELVGNTQVEQRLVPGMVKGLSGQGAKPVTQRVGGQNVVLATTKSTHIVAWYRGGVIALVIGNGTDNAPSLAFAKAYLSAR